MMNFLGILQLKDFIEIAFISAFIYPFFCWLKKDKTKPLLGHFFMISTILIVAHHTNMPTIINFITWLLPVLTVCFIVLHQDVLQRNVITAKIITPATHHNVDWIEELIRACLKTNSSGKNCYCVIELTDSLQSFIETNFFVNACAHQQLCQLFLQQSQKENSFIWFNKVGSLIAIDCCWKIPADLQFFEAPVDKKWQADALWYSSKLDCIIIYCTENNFSIICQGKSVNQLNATQAITLIKHSLYSTQKLDKKGEKSDAVSFTTRNQSYSEKQLNP